ncbi:hypothetical protein BOTBODRAFT_35520 [Botryobasidium botryosum FD-172 SS1]|uniref:Glucose-methanol-choline oxidoreductase C-terminal domain-containing protein n=1 Tax=Botryobasidium botryosum (strain FD-172 SS1) TaxID=930990 RepID=A0A067MI12_BOTB1|nr:hypothetical protein BOTBODRAFT_35520 [Botryobasidium botryosum FD-172 SS1]
MADYLAAPAYGNASFHVRIGAKPPQASPANECGFPQPGVQSPSAYDATTPHYFVDKTTWDNIIDHGDFDDVVVGSGFCALAYVSEALKRDPFRKILMLERGEFWLPAHFQNLPLPFKAVLGGPSETFPWTLSPETYRIPEVKYLHGSCPFFGGRSTFWSAWCPIPSKDLMRGFPESLLATAYPEGAPSEGLNEFWANASSLLNVTKADKINNGTYSQLQRHIDQLLRDGKIPSVDYTEAGPLAVGNPVPTARVRFNKFSTPGPLLAIQDRQRKLYDQGKGSPLMIASNVTAKKMLFDGKKVVVLETSRGALCFPKGKTNVILAAGAIPNTTILLNSVKALQDRAGSRLTGHFLSHIAARFKIGQKLKDKIQAEVDELGGKDRLQMAASYVAGRDKSGLQYHVQVTALHSPNPLEDAEEAARQCPDYAAAATPQQLKDSEGYIVLVCATLGEFYEHNPNSWVRRNPQDPDPTTNVQVQLTLAKEDRELWDTMDDATYHAIKVMAGEEAGTLEYWHPYDTAGNGAWKSEQPNQADIRIPGAVHEASTLFVGPESERQASVDKDYKPFGTENVYVTGAALFPSAGSWNPTLTMCGYAQDLATKIVPKRNMEEIEKRMAERRAKVAEFVEKFGLQEKLSKRMKEAEEELRYEVNMQLLKELGLDQHFSEVSPQ